MAKFESEMDSLLSDPRLTMRLTFSGGSGLNVKGIVKDTAKASYNAALNLEAPKMSGVVDNNTTAYAGNTWVSLLSDDVNLAVTSTYSAPFEQMMESMNNMLNMAKVGGVMLANGVNMGNKGGGGGAALPQLLNYSATLNTYSSTQRPQFDFLFTFVRTRLAGGINPIERAQQLFAACFPEGDGKGALTPPGGYALDVTNPSGVWMLEIGEYIKIPNLNLNSVSPIISSVLSSDGLPLYATCQVQLEPHKLPSASEVKQWFVTKSQPPF